MARPNVNVWQENSSSFRDKLKDKINPSKDGSKIKYVVILNSIIDKLVPVKDGCKLIQSCLATSDIVSIDGFCELIYLNGFNI